MYTIQVKITIPGVVEGPDYLIFKLGDDGYECLTSSEADVLIDMFTRNSSIFESPVKREYENADIVLIDPNEEDKYSEVYALDLYHVYNALNQTDRDVLDSMERIGAINQKYIAANI